jgi:hypothetical protein
VEVPVPQRLLERLPQDVRVLCSARVTSRSFPGTDRPTRLKAEPRVQSPRKSGATHQIGESKLHPRLPADASPLGETESASAENCYRHSAACASAT